MKIQESLPKEWVNFITFYIPEGQVGDYADVLDGWHLVEVPKKHKYIGCQRQWIMENRECRYVVFFDDDLSFSWRDCELKLHKSGDDMMNSMLLAIYRHLKEVPVVSISPRFGNNRMEKDLDYNCRAHTAWAIDGELYDELGIKFDPIKPMVMEDFHVALCFLEQGYKNVRLFNYCFNPLIESNGEGGCSTWRTFKVHDVVTQWMSDNHPTFERVFKTSKTGWNGFPVNAEGEKTRWDARIGWKKAYRPKVDKNVGISKFL
jgi:hypothetical protein